jgi:hypothetical protein
LMSCFNLILGYLNMKSSDAHDRRSGAAGRPRPFQ